MNWDEIYAYLVAMGFGDYLIARGIFLVSMLAAKVFSRCLARILLFLASKTSSDLDTKILTAGDRLHPLSLLPVLILPSGCCWRKQSTLSLSTGCFAL